jgi:hypothetical protein
MTPVPYVIYMKETMDDFDDMELDDLIANKDMRVIYIETLEGRIRAAQAAIVRLSHPDGNPLVGIDEYTRAKNIADQEDEIRECKKEIRRALSRIEKLNSLIAKKLKKKLMREETTIWNPIEHLITEEDRAAYLDAAQELGDPQLLQVVLEDIEESRLDDTH